MRRKPQRGPTSYPVACLPQAWASAAPFALLTAALGLQFDAQSGRVRFVRPRLPEFLDEVEIRNLRIGAGALDVLLRRRDSSVGVTVLRRSGSVSVEVVP
jgi:glycogen debranching enzyme